MIPSTSPFTQQPCVPTVTLRRMKMSSMPKTSVLPFLLPVAILLGGLTAMPSWGESPARLDGAGVDTAEIDWWLEPRAGITDPKPFGFPTMAPLALVVDDGSAEADFGIGGTAAQQFLWFNQLTAPRPLRLEEIQVLFPPASGVLDVGAAIDLVVYADVDADPTNGAQLVAVFSDVVQVADGVTFSEYPVALEMTLGLAGDVYLGVIPRFLASGVTPPTAPAALDTTASQGRSWLAVWQADPPASPELPPDGQLLLIDDLVPGNWMIRGLASPAPVTDVPAADELGLALLVALLLTAALVRLRDR